MSPELFDALKAWVEAKAVEIADDRMGRDTLTEGIRAYELEKDVRALLTKTD